MTLGLMSENKLFRSLTSNVAHLFLSDFGTRPLAAVTAVAIAIRAGDGN